MYDPFFANLAQRLLAPLEWLTFVHRYRLDLLRRQNLSTSVVIEGTPINDDLRKLFSLWGTVTGIIVDAGHIKAHFEHGDVITFIPVGEL